MELWILGTFCVLLICSLVLHFPLLIALAGGLLLFLGYAARKGFSSGEMLDMTLSGIHKAKNILITFFLIGVLTALWRAAGTIAAIVSYAAGLLHPAVILLMCFLLNCLVSFLTGTAFGTGATMGVICAAVASAMGVSPVLAGGAILSGAFFGDRCSPVSTSMLLVAELTETDSYENIRTMFRTAAVPFAVACVLFAGLGIAGAGNGAVPDLRSVFSAEFSLHWITLAPAVVILLLALCRVKIKTAMLVSIGLSIPICMFLQGCTAVQLLRYAVLGFAARTEQAAQLLNGGGIQSMVRGVLIVCISSAYTGIFEQTGLLTGIRGKIAALAEKTNAYTAVMCTAVLTAMAACNQTLAIMLTDQLCKELVPDQKRFASWLENTVVVIAPLIPWSIACTTVLNAGGLPLSGVGAAFYLYLVPLWGLVCSVNRKKTAGRETV